ncbi:4Fe-4S dicluster domain-containing protein [bacterium]|nr:4Fe-4S dicluster domain-containing protein [bacterium]
MAEQSRKSGSINPEKPKDMVPIYIMGKRYFVPKTLTIMKAIEYAGYQLKRGAGCRAGFCGACGTVYRTPDSYKIKVGLACQTVVEPEMYIAQLPFYPAVKKTYNIEEMEPTAEAVLGIYPEVARCVACNTCTKVCPQELDVMDYIQETLHGNLDKVADLSFDCVMCGLCVSRCPAEIQHPFVAILVRRLYNHHLVPRSQQLARRVREVEEGKYDAEIKWLKSLSLEQLKKLYSTRPREGDPGVELKDNKIDWNDEVKFDYSGTNR